ncbi:MAG: hypothetical protein Q9197_005984 [Variospora fuerteventurae]
MSSPSSSQKVLEEMQLDFLGLPVEIRTIIYDLYLPLSIRLREKNNFELAILRTSKQIHQEALWVLRQRHLVSLELLDQTSCVLTLMWLDRLGDDLAWNIRSLEIGAWLDVWRGLRTVLFRWCLVSFAFGGASPGFTIKYMFPDSTATWKFQHSRALHSRPGLCQHLKAEMALILAGKDRITVRTGGLRSIVEAIARYTKYSRIDHPDAQHIARKEPPPPPFWTDPDIQQWAYILPVTHPNERVVSSPSLILSGGPTYGMRTAQIQSPANVRLAPYRSN